MSPRAACRLERMGFREVYDYTAGIADWKAAGLHVEGEEAVGLLVADATRGDVPTVLPDESVATARQRAEIAGWSDVLVLDCGGVVVGRLRSEAWDVADAVLVEQVMESGPTTVRPDGSLAELLTRMERRPTPLVVVSDPQGVLVGAVLLDDARRLAAGQPPERVWKDCDGCPGRWAGA